MEGQNNSDMYNFLFLKMNMTPHLIGHSNEYRYVKAFGEDRWYGENLSKSHLNLR